jgi:hypothetical protein
MGSKNQTQKSRYKSRFSPETFVTIQQYILEIICSRKAFMEKREIGLYFWKNEEWANFYKRWLRSVHKLSKKYSPEAILHALEDPRGKFKWSLDTEFMKGLIAEHQIKIDKEKDRIKDLVPIEITEGESFRENRPSKVDKLLDLD